MASFRDLLAKAKSEIREVDTATADDMRRLPGTVVLDVREPDEYEQGALPGALHIPRGHLEAQIEGKVPDHDTPLVVYCAGGVRSAFAAKTLGELGYTDVVSMAGGFGRWKDEGREWAEPTQLNAEQRNRYQRHLLLPEVGVEGQSKLLDVQGAAARRRRPRLTGRAVPRRRRRRHDRHRRHGRGRRVEPAAPDPAQRRPHRRPQGRLGEEDADRAEPRRQRRHLRHAPRRRQRPRHHRRLRRHHRRRRQLPVALPAQRRVGEDRIPVVHGSIFRFEGRSRVFDPYDGPELPRHGARAAARRAGSVAAPRPACSACCPASSARSRRSRRSSSSSASASRSPAGCCAYDALEQSFRTYKVLRDPECPACSLDPADIVIAEYDELCMPHRAH